MPWFAGRFTARHAVKKGVKNHRAQQINGRVRNGSVLNGIPSKVPFVLRTAEAAQRITLSRSKRSGLG